MFRNVIQKALKEGRFKLADKKGANMTIDTDPFPPAAINMVSVLVECKGVKKDISSLHTQPINQI